MTITYKRDENQIIFGSKVFTVTNRVRNEIDPANVRRIGVASEVRYTVNADRSPGKPYMPRKFPKGVWEITGVEYQKDKGFDVHDYGQVRIRTNAHQKVQLWSIDVNGGYNKPLQEFVDDYGYLFHYSESNTTLGCGRIDTQPNALALADLCLDAMKNGHLYVEVV